MNRAIAFPHFDDAWILHSDEDIVVVDKPTGVPSQSPDPDRPDDVPARLRAHGGFGYLGVHQRLDRDTSGVLLLTARKEANAKIAAAFEGRTVEKTYVACVTGWPAKKATATLRDRLLPGDDGRMRVAGPKERGGVDAIAHVKVLGRAAAADRTMIEIVLETGRTHQARVQLAHAGAPIAGDRLYRGAAASRLMLHASSLRLPGDLGHFTAKTPAEFNAWLRDGDLGIRVYDDPGALAAVLAQAARARYGMAHGAEGERATTAFRLVNEAGDALPHLAVDVYGTHLVAQLYDDGGKVDGDAMGVWGDAARRDRVLDALDALGFDGVYLKVRPKQSNTLVDTRREDLAPKAPVRGIAAADPVVVHEEGIPYLARLGDGLSTGIFLDQRANRRRVRELAAGGSVVNLFAYTCAFSVAAAVGGAWRTISVDASVVALERGRENMREAGVLESAEHHFAAEDAFAWLAHHAKEKKEKKDKTLHDLVLLDPPSYSSTKKRRFVADHDYAELAALALAILRPGGKLLACTNHRGISKGRFRKMLFDGARKAGREVASIKDTSEPLDFPPAISSESHLKAAIVTLAN